MGGITRLSGGLGQCLHFRLVVAEGDGNFFLLIATSMSLTPSTFFSAVLTVTGHEAQFMPGTVRITV